MLDISIPFEINFWEVLKYKRETIEWTLWHNTDTFLQLWGKVLEKVLCSHELSTLYVLFKANATLLQRPNTHVDKTLWLWGCSLYRHCHYNIRDMLWGELFYPSLRQCWLLVVIWCLNVDVMQTLWLWRHDFNVVATLLIQHS